MRRRREYRHHAQDSTDGPLGAGHYARKYTYAGDQGDTLFIDADWNFDGYLVLEGPNGFVVAENDNYTSSLNSRIEHQLAKSGTHTVWVTSYAPGGTGSGSLSLQCNSQAGPDLTLGAPTVPAGQLIPGQSLAVQVQLRNDGGQEADSTTLRYLLSSDNRISLSDTELGADEADALGAEETSQNSLTVSGPATPGHWWLGVCTDEVPDEASSSNNCSPATEIVVGEALTCRRSDLPCGGLSSGSGGVSSTHSTYSAPFWIE